VDGGVMCPAGSLCLVRAVSVVFLSA
jgi:hypothetical protein